ncbi:NAD-dependent epimerase/dehydratase family protein, partial [Streptomyces sp. NPDC055157]
MMILVTGGLGFIGSHTVRALLDLGEDCVVVQRHARELPAVLAGARVEVEQADVAPTAARLPQGPPPHKKRLFDPAGGFNRPTRTEPPG